MRDADTDPASSSNVMISGRQALIGASSRFLQDSREEMAEMFVKHGLRRWVAGLNLWVLGLNLDYVGGDVCQARCSQGGLEA